MGLFCVYLLHGMTTKINWDNYTVGVSTVSYLEGLPAVSSIYDSRSCCLGDVQKRDCGQGSGSGKNQKLRKDGDVRISC